MQILKHEKTLRFFVATPALLKNNKMVPATEAESRKFISKMSDKLRTETEEHHSTVEIEIPDDIDLDTDISNWGKPHLMALADRIKLVGVRRLPVKQLRTVIKNALEEAKSNDDSEPVDSGMDAGSEGGSVDYSEGVKIPEDFDIDTDISKLGKVELLDIAEKINMIGVKRVKVDELREVLFKVFSDAKSEQGE
ncbi:hypothetical protein A9Q81_11680 [Gammaproteobacteria bacterium 42_54_T18]|nr:hypothetical protein A9Q81_11680 [Gammaproteobacteria bacterium 42_54_T18]